MPSPLSPNARGSLYMALGTAGYVVNDALVRAATERGLDVYQALCLRGVALTVMFFAFGRIRSDPLARAQVQRPLVIRVLAEVISAAMFFGALVQLDFANAQTILMVVPFAVTLAAAILLGERVSGRQYAVVLAGFVGVLLVVQPATEAFSLWSLVVLASATGLVVREFATREIPRDVPATSIALFTSIGLTVLAGVISIFTGWGELTLAALGLIVLASMFLVAGYIFTIQTVRVGDLSISAPFRYTSVLGAVILGYAFFSEIPNAITFAGCAVILLSGVYTIRLEQRSSAESERSALA